MSKLKAFADNKLKVGKMTKFVLDWVENIVGKGENTGNQHFLLLQHVLCFPLYQEQNQPYEPLVISCLEMLPFWTSLKLLALGREFIKYGSFFILLNNMMYLFCTAMSW